MVPLFIAFARRGPPGEILLALGKIGLMVIIYFHIHAWPMARPSTSLYFMSCVMDTLK
jgi:hypothetical protein